MLYVDFVSCFCCIRYAESKGSMTVNDDLEDF
jgi:hypothetical protein